MVARKTSLFAVIGVTVMAAAAQAHQDDPKAKGYAPIYEGPGYRAAFSMLGGGDEFDSAGVELQAWLPINEFAGGGSGPSADCWGYVSPSGREYAIYGLECGTAFVEITNPANPNIIELIPGTCCIWRDIKTFGQFAYVVSECGSQGIQIVDLSDIDAGVVTHVRDVDGGIGGGSHNVALNVERGYLYRTGGDANGLAIYDLNVDAGDPPQVAVWDERYVHDAQVVTLTSGPWAGRDIAYCCSGFASGWVETGLDILDVTDPLNIIQLARYEYPNGVYSHQGWLSADEQYFFLGDELDEGSLGITTETKVIDVSDLENPVEVDIFTNGSTATGHNLFVKGDVIMQANYSSGFRVFNASDPFDVVEIAYFDTRPEDDDEGYDGLWAVYPYFPSGVVIGSDRQRGLFVWTLESSGTPGDVDADGDVDFTDLVSMLAAWGECPPPPADCPADVDGDGTVGFTDLLTLLANWSAGS